MSQQDFAPIAPPERSSKADCEPTQYEGSGVGPTKRCSRCREVLPHGAFYRRNRQPMGDGALTSECRRCTSAKTSARWKAKQATKGPSRFVDWTNPPAELACTGCGVVYPIETYPLAGANTKGATVRKRKCTPCRNYEQAERNKRLLLSEMQMHYAGRAEAQREVYCIRPTARDSAMAECGIARELYAQALRALSTSPPVPVWEREEWA